MRNKEILWAIIALMIFPSCNNLLAKIEITGEQRQWHKVTLTVDGPYSSEADTLSNPFTDYRMTVRFTHESGSPDYWIPGYFAADGNAAQTSAESGNKWRAHISPDKPGFCNYEVSINKGNMVAINELDKSEVVTVFKSKGRLNILPTDKKGPDFRGKGRLQYVGERYLKFAGTKEYFLKAGADSPENLLAYKDFDGTYSAKNPGIERNDEAATAPLKNWNSHVRDWKTGDPTWKDGKGKGLIGAINYLAGKGCNSFSFLTYNAGGDGDDVWPFVTRDDKLHFDCSKLDQWQIVFDHGQQLGMYLHFKLQETENDDNLSGEKNSVSESLDRGELGVERKLYLRELIARFGYQLALNWNLGEENTQTSEQQKSMAQYIFDIDPYHHHIVIHSYPDWQERVYPPLLGDESKLTGASLQNGWMVAHQQTLRWLKESEKSGKIWVVANDEQNPHYTGVPPDEGYDGFDGTARPERWSDPYTLHDIRKYTLWGNIMAGGAGVEYYFGYTLPQTDLNCEDWRSRDQSWTYAGIALQFFNENEIPFWKMQNNNELIGNTLNKNSKYCLAVPGEYYLIYLPNGGSTDLNMEENTANYKVRWFNPREGGSLQSGSISQITADGNVSIGEPPIDITEDWVALIKRD